MPSTMRTWQIVGEHTLAPADVPVSEPGPAEVLVRVAAVAVNYRDLLVTAGGYGREVPVGAVPCSDAAGEIVAAGRDVQGLVAGQRVTTTFAPDWQDGGLSRAALRTTLGSGRTPGVLAEYLRLPAHAVVPAPPSLTMEEAATLPCAGLTAWHALFAADRTGPGRTVLTMGTGGVSIFAVQMALRAGATVIATSGSDGKLARLRAMGVAETINYRSTPDWGEHVRARTRGGEGVDLVVEVGGQGTLQQSLRAVRPGGTVALIGTLAGPAPVDLAPVFLRNITLAGILVGSRSMALAMYEAVASWQLRPVIDTVVPFADAPAAFERLRRGLHVGKVVIRAGGA